MLKPICQISPLAPADIAITPNKKVAFPPVSTIVGIVSVKVIEINNNRTGLVIVNLSPNNVSIGIGVSAVVGAGITLTPNGVWEMDNFTFCVEEIYAIASGANSAISIQEFS